MLSWVGRWTNTRSEAVSGTEGWQFPSECPWEVVDLTLCPTVADGSNCGMLVGIDCTPCCGLIRAGNLGGVETKPGYLICPTGVSGVLGMPGGKPWNTGCCCCHTDDIIRHVDYILSLLSRSPRSCSKDGIPNRHWSKGLMIQINILRWVEAP